MRILATLAATALLAVPATASLAPGAKAPDFATRGARAGQVVNVRLSQLLAKGPVVLYFFPAAYTGGCNVEAQAFAEAVPQFAAAGATVLGMSGNTVEVLKDFSAEKCAGKFTVASAGPKVIAGYDVSLGREIDTPRGKVVAANRVSYVIARDGRIVAVHANLAPADHVKMTLADVQKLKG
ncbi:peroxiredoxin [Sphingomonas sp. RS2018]